MSSPITSAYAQEQLERWLAALEAVSLGQSYSIGGRTLTRLDVDAIRGEIDRWDGTIKELAARAEGRTRTLGAKGTFPAPGSGTGPSGLYDEAIWRSGRT